MAVYNPSTSCRAHQNVSTAHHCRWRVAGRAAAGIAGATLLITAVRRRSALGTALGGALVGSAVASRHTAVEKTLAAQSATPRSVETIIAAPAPLLASTVFPPASAARGVVVPDPVAPEQDAAVRVTRSLAAIGTVLGALAFVGMLFGLEHLHQGDFAGDLRWSNVDGPLFHTTLNAAWMFVASAAGAGLGLVLLLGCLGALNARPWARLTLLLWSCASLSVGILGCFFYPRWLFSPLRDRFSEVRGVVDSLANFGGWALGSLLAIALLIMLTRPTVRRAFERHS